MRPILLVEDSALFSKLVLHRISKAVGRPVIWAKSFVEAESVLRKTKEGFALAILDLNLPDAAKGEVVPLVVERGISCVVFTADDTGESKEMAWSQGVADYIIKGEPSSLDCLLGTITGLLKYENTLILVASADSSVRTRLSDLLYVRKYRVINASSGEAALNILAQHPNTRLVLCDADLDDIGGFEFCRKIREVCRNNHVGLVGMVSGSGNKADSRFLESEANEVLDIGNLVVKDLYEKVQACLEKIEI